MAEALAIILGATEWPHYPAFGKGPVDCFGKSAAFFKDYFTGEEGLDIEPDNILWLFNTEDQPSQIIQKVTDFLKKNTNESITDIFFYYVGHGTYISNNYA